MITKMEKKSWYSRLSPEKKHEVQKMRYQRLLDGDPCHNKERYKRNKERWRAYYEKNKEKRLEYAKNYAIRKKERSD